QYLPEVEPSLALFDPSPHSLAVTGETSQQTVASLQSVDVFSPAILLLAGHGPRGELAQHRFGRQVGTGVRRDGQGQGQEHVNHGTHTLHVERSRSTLWLLRTRRA